MGVWTFLHRTILVHSLLAIWSTSQTASTCGYRPPLASEVSYARSSSPGHSTSKRQTHQSIRIAPFYDSTVDSLSAAQQNLIKVDVVPELLTFVRNVLSVKPFSGNILLSRDCALPNTRLFNPDISITDTFCNGPCASTTMCGPFAIPNDHLTGCQQCTNGRNCQTRETAGAGVANTDFVLYISANGSSPCGQSSQLIAFAAHCQLDPTSDRPLAGYANLCPNALNLKDLKSTVKHELLHALGISSQLFPYWRNPDGTPRTGRDSQGQPPIQNNRFVADTNTVMSTSVTRQTINGPRSQTVSFIVTEAVRREARAHFGCTSLVGAELENQGGDATAGSHWEKRIFENEAMTGVTTQNPAFSRVTLAALEDSGWYQVNYDQAMPFRFGQDLGCNFTDESCYHWWTNNPSPLPYCNVQPPAGSTGRTDCTPDYYSKGRCNLVTFSSTIPQQFQYFSNSAQGGSAQIADYCPFYQEITFNNGRRTQCSVSANQPTDSSNVFAETYGSTSRCFRHGASRTWTIIGQSFTSTGGSGCYEYTCSPSSGVTVYVLGTELACNCGGMEIPFTVTGGGYTYMGAIVCPTCRDLCWDQLQLCPSSCLGSSSTAIVMGTTSTPQPAATSSSSATGNTASNPASTSTAPTSSAGSSSSSVSTTNVLSSSSLVPVSTGTPGVGSTPARPSTSPTSGAATAGIGSLLIVLTSCLVLWAV